MMAGVVDNLENDDLSELFEESNSRESSTDTTELVEKMGNMVLNVGFVTQSQKNKPQLYLNGYYFRTNNSSLGKITWRCTGKSCCGSCFTNGNNIGEKYNVTIVNSDHNHAPDPIKLKNLEKRRKIKIKGMQSDEPPRKTLANFEDEESIDEEIANSASYSADRQALNRAKKLVLPQYPPIPVKLNDITLPNFLLHTLGNGNVKEELFLMHDSGIDDEERFFIFGSEKNIKHLEDAHVFADGTFDIAPLLFLQVYSLHAIVQGRCLPMIYGVLPRKTQEMYTRFLKEISKRMYLSPKTITSDFEKAFLNACAKIFPLAELFGCFFHFKKNMFAKIQNLGLVELYLKEPFRKLLKLPQVLAYVPPGDVRELFYYLKSSLTTDEENRIGAFYEYVEEFYIGKQITKTKGIYYYQFVMCFDSFNKFRSREV